LKPFKTEYLCVKVIGGLLSAHLLSYRLYLEPGTRLLDVSNSENLDPNWPCDGKLLRLAVKVAEKILPAFNTATGMPYGTINLKNGVPKDETTETCVAGVGTFLVEFSTLSRLTGNTVYEKTALRAMDSLWQRRTDLNLIGNHINVASGKWTGLDATIGSGVDSYFEYLVKAGILLDNPELIKQFQVYKRSIDKFLLHDNWFVWANMNKGQKTLPLFSSLEAFWPGLLTLTGDLKQAIQITKNYHKIWRKYGALPEFYNIQQDSIHSNRESYPLRPELIESLMYLVRATGNEEVYYEMAVDYLESIERISRLKCGFATVKDVKDHRLENRMESFFLAETLKYLYLIFDETNFLHNDLSADDHKIVKNELGKLIFSIEFVLFSIWNSFLKIFDRKKGECLIETGFFFFNTEAHPVDGASLECCRMLRSKTDNPETPSLLQSLNLEKLLNKHIGPFTTEKYKQNEDLVQDKANDLLKEEIERNFFANLCNRMVNNTVDRDFILSSMGQYFNTQNPFTCTTNDTFSLQMSFINTQSYFP